MPSPSDHDPRRRHRSSPGALYQVGALTGAGVQFAVTVALGVTGGWWLDGRLGTSPLFLIAGGLLGAVAAFYHLYRALVNSTKDRPDRDEGENGEAPT